MATVNLGHLEEVQTLTRSLLTQKDLSAEQLMTVLIEHAESGLCNDLSKEEKTAELNKKVHAKLHKLGSTVALKLQPLLKDMMEHLANQQTKAELAVIELPSLGLAEKTEIYKRLFLTRLKTLR